MDGQVSAPDGPLSMDEFGARIARLAGQLHAAEHRWLLLIAEFDRREGWHLAGARSCAHWLNWKVGLDLGAARERVRVAEPATEGYLLSIALSGTAQHVEKLVRAWRRVRQAEELAREARLTAEAGAALIKALEIAVESMPAPADVSAETSLPREPVSARRADALGLIAEGYLHGGAAAVQGGERMDYGLAIDVLLGQRVRAIGQRGNVSAETSR